ncbi:MAG: cyclic pyranopterin monophosphate synthase MoaC [Candidatus Nanopelagicales bacterium]|nr:cyclic pyranopterin monophosphate synthase MoaC [Candidatus Nanopelagicales bacterium]
MVNVGEKPITRREASAKAIVATIPEVVSAIRSGQIEKGDVIAAGRLAGIMAVKRTPDLLPLCHPIGVTNADVFIECGEDTLEITSCVGISDRTGVEMEALTAVAVAGLAVIDMIKSRDAAAQIQSIRLMEKSGGKSGHWVRGDR